MPYAIKPPVLQRIVGPARKDIDTIAAPGYRGRTGGELAFQRLPVMPASNIQLLVQLGVITTSYENIEPTATPQDHRVVRHEHTYQLLTILPPAINPFPQPSI